MADSWADLPGKCFVSHSYQDSDVVTKLQTKEKMHDRLILFPRVEPDPSHAVSDGIVTQILACDALIYVREGASASSFWVSFERDYALRAGRPVYAYSPIADVLIRDTSSPLDLDLRVMFHREDEKRIATLFEWMKTQRHVDLEEARSRSQRGGITGDVRLLLQEHLFEGRPILWLGSARVAMPMTSFAAQIAPLLSNVPEFRTDFIKSQLHEYSQGDDLQDQEHVAEANEDFYREMDPYIFTPEVAARIDPSLPKSWQAPGCAFLDLLQEDTESFNWNRIDDLIIRLYAALWQHRRRRIASPPNSSAVSVENLGLLAMFWDQNPDWTGRIRIGAARNPDETKVPQRERWWLGRWDGQKLLDDCALYLYELFGKRPSRISRQSHPHLLFDEDLTAAFALGWRVDPAVVELSLVIEGPYSMVILRRYAIDSIEGGLPQLEPRE